MLDIASTLEQVVHLVRAAGAVLLQGVGHSGTVEYKGEVDLVTEYDRRAETLLTNAINQLFPDHHIVAEEHGDAGRGDSHYTWLIDPLDGTTNYAHGFPVFSVSVGLVRDGQELIGVVYDPTREETFCAAAGSGTFLNGKPVHVSETTLLDRALLGTGFAYDRRTAADNNVGNLARFIRRCQGVRRTGSAALDLSYVACGRLDGFWEMGLHPWDVAAGTLLVREAGGNVTDFSGGHADHQSGRQVVGSNGRIHDQILTVLAAP